MLPQRKWLSINSGVFLRIQIPTDRTRDSKPRRFHVDLQICRNMLSRQKCVGCHLFTMGQHGF